jgi:hypothetical protein
MGKSLLSQTSKTKSKRRSSTNKTIKTEYLFDLHEQVTYEGGLYKDKKGIVCTIISRSQNRNGKKYYKIEFEDGLVVESIEDVLKKKEVDEIID